jgi:hypothetical protein
VALSDLAAGIERHGVGETDTPAARLRRQYEQLLKERENVAKKLTERAKPKR